jgi:hypothetical protein
VWRLLNSQSSHIFFRRSLHVLFVSEINHDLWFAPMATVRTARFSFDLFYVVDAKINELLHGYVLIVPTFHALDVQPMFWN